MATFSAETFLQIFTEHYGETLAKERFDDIFEQALGKNEIVQSVIDVIDWEFKAFETQKTKCYKAIDTIN